MSIGIEDIKHKYKHSQTVNKLDELLVVNNAKINLKGTVGASLAFISSALIHGDNDPHIFIFSDKEEAAYFFNTLENINPDWKGKKVFFYPASYKRPYQIEKTDNANVLQRAEVLNVISKRRCPQKILLKTEHLPLILRKN